jgi:general secretion pathway protein K
MIGILSAFVTELAKDTYFFDDYSQRIISQEQIYFMSDVGIEAVKNILEEDDSKYDSFNDNWAQQMPVELKEASFTIEIVDQERYLNPNILVNQKDEIDEKAFDIFQRLFYYLEIDTQVLYNIIDWIDKNKDSSGGEEDYIDFPAKNDKIDTLEELKMIKGITPEIFEGKKEEGKTVISGEEKPGLKDVLSPYSDGKVNINTASVYVLMSLDDDIDESLASSIIAYRKENPFTNVNDLIKVDGMNSDIIYRIKNFVDVKSKNFLVNIKINFGDREFRLIALLERNGKKVEEKWRKLY